MWTARKQPLGEDIVKVTVEDRGRAVAWTEVLGQWRGDDDSFRLLLVDVLRTGPFGCFRFETPPLTRTNTDEAFQFVLVDSPQIDLAPSPDFFREHFDRQSGEVLVFDNLGGDATLIVPRPHAGMPGYAHIAAFTSHAPMDQQLRLWKTVGETMHGLLGDAPLWLNTAGGGVPWLHVRIDSRPKYYVFDEYRAAPPSICG